MHADAIVAVCVTRSFAFVATCWAVLQAGARLLLVDRDLAPQRVRDMLDEADVSLVVIFALLCLSGLGIGFSTNAGLTLLRAVTASARLRVGRSRSDA